MYEYVFQKEQIFISSSTVYIQVILKHFQEWAEQVI